MEPLFLSLDEVLELHQQQIARYGGSAGLRDAAALEAAVATPQGTFGGEFLHTFIPAMAAAYLFHICQNHPFVDGNKRAGANAPITFLLMNDWEPTFEEEELSRSFCQWRAAGCRRRNCPRSWSRTAGREKPRFARIRVHSKSPQAGGVSGCDRRER